MKIWKPIILTLAVFALPVVGLVLLFVLGLFKTGDLRIRQPKDYPE